MSSMQVPSSISGRELAPVSEKEWVEESIAIHCPFEGFKSTFTCLTEPLASNIIFMRKARGSG